MRKNTLRIVLFIVFSYLLLYMGSFVYHLLTYPGEELLYIYRIPWLFEESLRTFIQLLPAVHITAILLAFAVRTRRAGRSEPIEDPSAALRKILLLFMLFTLVFSILDIGVHPMLQRHRHNRLYLSRVGMDYLQRANQADEEGDLETALASGLARHRVPARLLGLELTESVLLDERAGDIAPRLEKLRRQGHGIAIDDFGTGYSSLGYLKHLPVDKLKLDRAFIHALPGDRADAAIVCAVLAMARGLELEVIAEGVETEAQRDFLLAQGCAQVQGFFYARPRPAAQLEAQWREQASAGLSAQGKRVAEAPA